MRIAFISHDGSLAGGSSRSLLDLIDGLSEYHVEPLVICPFRGGLTAALEERQVPFAIVPFKPWLRRDGLRSWIRAAARILWNLLLISFCVARVARFNADVIYTNTSVTPVGALVAMVLGKPHVWHAREVPQLGLGMKHGLGSGLMTRLMNRADAVITVSVFVREYALRDVTAPIYTVRDGIFSGKEAEKYYHLESSPGVGGEYVFSCVGHIRPSKNQEEAVRALSLVAGAYPEAKLLLVGSGEDGYVAGLRRLCARLGVEEKVGFTGHVDDPMAIFRACDATVICSRHEALPRVAIESMVLKKPVIGCRSGGVAEIIRDRENGLLYENTSESLASCMMALLEDADLARRLGEEGWKSVYEMYRKEEQAKRVHEILRDVKGGWAVKA